MLFRRLRITVNAYTLEYESDYGIDKRSGWFVHYDGSVLVQFSVTAIGAMFKAWPMVREIKKYRRSLKETNNA